MLFADIEEIHECLNGVPKLLASLPTNQLRTPCYLREKLQNLGICTEEVRIFALTQPGILSYSFNPVTFYFAYHRNNLVALLVDVTNTPYEERHCYALKTEDNPKDQICYRFAFDKDFFVSPFLPMLGTYRVRVSLKRTHITVAMRLESEVSNLFAVLSLELIPYSRSEIKRISLLHPLQNLNTVKTIYWHAFRLLFKGVPIYPHTKKTEVNDESLPNHSNVH